MEVIAECYILDVGQGSSSVVLLGQSRCIVIDCPRGPHCSPLPTLRLLQRHGIASIEVLAISHNDADHEGGAAAILMEYSSRIGQVAMLQDRAAPDMRFARAVLHARDRGQFAGPVLRLETPALGQRKVLWEDRKRSLRLVVLYPDFAGNLGAQVKREPNQTSAVLAFCGPNSTILFPGDCGIDAWAAIAERSPDKRVECDVVAVPHHGGLTGGALSGDWVGAVRRAYSEVLRAKVGIVSVGTFNPYGHPRAEVIRSLTSGGAVVMCTQITSKCCAALDRLGVGVLSCNEFSCSTFGRKSTRSGQPKNVACAGSVVLEITDRGLAIPRLQEHRRAIQESRLVKPLCC